MESSNVPLLSHWLENGHVLFEETRQYRDQAKCPREKLMYDQGEDRWLCTLLLLTGGRIEFEAGSHCQTFAPEDLSTFFKQRRRWGPSTLMNLYETITKVDQERILHDSDSPTNQNVERR